MVGPFMAENYLNQLSRIPSCIPGVQGPEGLRDWLSGLNQKADEISNHSDDSFSREDFQYARTQSWGASLNRFSSFEHFQNRISQFIEDNMNSERCSCLGTYVEEGENGGTCIPDPEAPKRPSPPKVQKKLPNPGQNKKSPPPANGLDIAQLNIHAAPWWSQEAPKKPEAPPGSYLGSMPSLSAKDFVDQDPSSLAAYVEDVPKKVPTHQPYFNAHFDGKDFILDFYGCVVNLPSLSCVEDWSYFTLLLENNFSRSHSEKKAGADGWVRVKIGAQRGDIIWASGRDSFTQQPSLNRLKFQITESGEVEFLGHSLRNGKTVLPKYKPVTHVVPQIDSLFYFFKTLKQKVNLPNEF